MHLCTVAINSYFSFHGFHGIWLEIHKWSFLVIHTNTHLPQGPSTSTDTHLPQEHWCAPAARILPLKGHYNFEQEPLVAYCIRNNSGDLQIIGLRPVNNPNIRYHFRVSVSFVETHTLQESSPSMDTHMPQDSSLSTDTHCHKNLLWNSLGTITRYNKVATHQTHGETSLASFVTTCDSLLPVKYHVLSQYWEKEVPCRKALKTSNHVGKVALEKPRTLSTQTKLKAAARINS